MLSVCQQFMYGAFRCLKFVVVVVLQLYDKVTVIRH